MQDDRTRNDKSEYLDTGFRDDDGRAGFGDDKGTRVGSPDQGQTGAGQARVAPHDLDGGKGAPTGQPGTNASPVADGIEGSLTDDAAGPQQSRVRDAAEGIDEGPAAGDERRVFDL